MHIDLREGNKLMESTTPDGDVAKFIEKRGEGVMLISFNVDNTREAMAELKEKDYPFMAHFAHSILSIGPLRPARPQTNTFSICLDHRSGIRQCEKKWPTIRG